MSVPAAEQHNTSELSYEQAREELVSVVGKLEAGGASLEESLALWERGEALAARCEAWLEGARKRLDDAKQTQEAASSDSTNPPESATAREE